jgi:hypothetical protein
MPALVVLINLALAAGMKWGLGRLGLDPGASRFELALLLTITQGAFQTSKIGTALKQALRGKRP